MAYRYTDVNTRLVYSSTRGTVGNTGKIAKFWADGDGTDPIDIGLYSEATPETPGASTGTNQLTVRADSMWPAMWDRDGTQDYVWVQIGTADDPGTLYRIFCDADQRLDALGTSSTRDVGTAAGTVAAGDDSRITGAVQTTRTINTTTPLTGGGALSGDLTLAVSNATAVAQGVIRLAGDLAGSATAPLIATGAITSSKILDGTIVDDDIALTANINVAKVPNAGRRLTTTATKTTTYTAAVGELVVADATSAAFTVTLPSAATAGFGSQVAVRKIDSTTHAVTVQRAGSDTINASATSVTLALADEVMTFTSDGTSKWSVSAGFKSLATLDDRYKLRGEAYEDSADYTVRDGVTDDIAGLESWVAASIGTANPVSNVRTASKALYLSAGTYRITRRLNILSVMGLDFFGEGYRSAIVVDGTLDYGLYLNGVAFSNFSNFEIRGLAGQGGGDTVTTALALEYDPAVAARTSTQNNFSRIQVRGLDYTTAYAFGVESANLQVDQVTVYKCNASGSVTPWTSGNGVKWNYGFRSGSGTHGNILNHNYIGCVSNGHQYNLFSNAVNTSWYGGHMGYAYADVRHYGYTPLALAAFRTETSNRFLEQDSGQTLLGQVSIRDVRFVASGLHADGRVIVMGHPGELTIENFVVSEAGTNPSIYYNNGTSRALNVKAVGVRSTVTPEAFFTTAGSTSPMNVRAEHYTQYSAPDVQGPITPIWCRAINSSTPTLAVDRVAGDYLTTGEVIPEPWNITTNAISYAASGGLVLSYFTANKTEDITTVTAWSGTTAAGATPTLVRYGVYSVASNGNLTLVASTANDTTLLAATNTAYPKALSATWSKVAGVRYAIGVLVVTGAALPTFHGQQLAATNILNTLVRTAPYLTGRLTGQTDLPSSVTQASMVGTQGRIAFQLS